ncbi:MAG TPA: translation elongation factor Ts [Saprospiraceae bacterium]|nr:translation elongation factor Ts [Saprospiraceae bacterium]MCC6687952.1 elongation factor Ts [Saprospiraceae bacterium]HMV24532.1 translation elongation factor Ts [Saprospiraceae bacterium]HMX81740.1 translation elongation factor Ts [Saprospiraceae bacterium]HMX86110.1 translation elongation factor Ts [Saprospiraceae bacterium]
MSELVISASDVKNLRDQTGAGMMDCKKALIEAEGDFEKAVEVLRKQGQKLSVKRADREAKEGAVIALVSHNKNKGIVVRLSCETDFVAKNDGFVELTKQIAEIALKETPATIDDLLNCSFDGKISIAEKINEYLAAIGEKIELVSYESISTNAGEGQVLSYVHAGNRAGVIVALNLEGPQYEEAGRNVAMQVAAMKPLALDKDGVDASIVEKEIEIGKEQARAEGKPEAMLEKIALGKLNKFYQENTLNSQTYVKDGKMSVAEYLQSLHKDLKVTAFKHVALG